MAVAAAEGDENSPERLLYAYEWKLCASAMSSVNALPRKKAHMLIERTNTTYMKHEDVHCTTHKHLIGDMKRKITRKLALTCLYGNKHRCTVSLPETTSSFHNHTMGDFGGPWMIPTTSFHVKFPFLIPDFAPHVSMAKHSKDKWQDLGSWVKGYNERKLI